MQPSGKITTSVLGAGTTTHMPIAVASAEGMSEDYHQEMHNLNDGRSSSVHMEGITDHNNEVARSYSHNWPLSQHGRRLYSADQVWTARSWRENLQAGTSTAATQMSDLSNPVPPTLEPRLSAERSLALAPMPPPPPPPPPSSQLGWPVVKKEESRWFSRGAFRLLSILPGKPFDVIRCEILDSSYNAAPPYTAVSYCWGNHHYTSKIHIVNFNTNITITLNGFAALKDLRLETKPRLVWMDALCIDQSDEIDKAMQVGIMGHIFFCAQSCIAYVGWRDPISDKVFAMVEAHKKGRLTELPTRRELLSRFMQRAWFTRLWVVQEALLSTNITLQCERLTMDFDDFSKICEDTIEYRTSPGAHPFKPAYRIVELRRLYTQQQPGTRLEKLIRLILEVQIQYPKSGILPSVGSLYYRTLFNVMYATQEYGCSDLRDRIFAILSLFDGPIPDLLQPDYTASVRTIRNRVFQFLCTELSGVGSGISPKAIQSHVDNFFSQDRHSQDSIQEKRIVDIERR